MSGRRERVFNFRDPEKIFLNRLWYFPKSAFLFPFSFYEILKFKENFLNGVFHVNVVALILPLHLQS